MHAALVVKKNSEVPKTSEFSILTSSFFPVVITSFAARGGLLLCPRFSRRFDGGFVVASPEDEDGRDVSEVGDDLGEGWVAVVTEEGLQQLPRQRVLVEDHVHIPDVFDNGRNPADFIELVNAMRDESRREEDEQNAGDLEEFTQVKAHSGGEDGVTEQRRRAETEDRADQNLNDGGACLGLVARKKRGGDEDGELNALTHDRHERHPEDRALAGGGGGLVHARFEFAFEEAGLFAHPEDHPGEDACGEKHGDALEDLLGRPFERHAEGGEQ